jgi:hypothetical protein
MFMSLRSFWVSGRRVERAGYLVGALLLISGIVHITILIVTGTSWVGPLSLRKPAVFGLSFGVTLITIVWVASFLPLAERTRAALLTIFIAASVVETGWSRCRRGAACPRTSMWNRRSTRWSRAPGRRRHCARGGDRRVDGDGVPPESGRADQHAEGDPGGIRACCASQWRPAPR